MQIYLQDYKLGNVENIAGVLTAPSTEPLPWKRFNSILEDTAAAMMGMSMLKFILKVLFLFSKLKTMLLVKIHLVQEL